MKTIKLLGYAFFTMLLSVSFSACGGDDDSGSGGGTPSTNKRLVKITEKGESNTYTYEYTYDGQGRVIRKEVKKNGSDNGYYTFSYTDKKIVKKHFSATGTKSSEYEYKLENGLIVECTNSDGTERNTYENGRLVTKTTNKYTYKYTWSNGNLMTIEREGKIKRYEYTNQLAPQGVILWDDEELAAYYGIIPKNLPSKFIDGDSEELLFEWTFGNGLPVQMIMTESSSKGVYTDIFTYEWQ